MALDIFLSSPLKDNSPANSYSSISLTIFTCPEAYRTPMLLVNQIYHYFLVKPVGASKVNCDTLIRNN
ncbi:MAG: hypothetical protein AB8U93_01030 [Francisella endosymbiont of Hyalomma scupense]